jgi:hypothetical protein
MSPYTLDIAASTDSLHSTDILRKWLHECTETHSNCREMFPRASFVPSRLIEIRGHSEAKLEIRLCEGEYGLCHTPYTTLSHCWGSTVLFKLLISNRDALLNKISLSDLPKVFQDAIILTWRLQFRHIWIDSLCKLVRSKSDSRTKEDRYCSRL